MSDLNNGLVPNEGESNRCVFYKIYEDPNAD